MLPQDLAPVPGALDVWLLAQVVLVLVSAIAAPVGASSGVVFELVAPEAVLVVSPLPTGSVTLPEGSGKLPIARSLASDDRGYAMASRQGRRIAAIRSVVVGCLRMPDDVEPHP